MSRPLILGAAALLLPAALAAQTTLQIPLGNASIGTPSPSPTPAPFPSPVFTPAPRPAATPSPLPTASSPLPTATSSSLPRATPTPARTPRPVTTPTPGGTPAVEATAAASADPAAPPTPAATGTPEPAPTPAPTATLPIETVVLPRAASPANGPLWPWFAGAAILLLALATLVLRRRPAAPGAEDAAYTPEPSSLPKPAPVPAPAPPATTRLRLDLRPTRAGTNLLTATLEAEVVVTNLGDAPARDIRVAVGLLGADGNEAAGVEALATEPVTQPAVPRFTLAPGEERRFRAVAALPLDAIPPLAVAGRPLFVPLAVVTAAWIDGDLQRRTTHGFAVGVERVDSAKLAPLWLDTPSRSYDGVAARPHGQPRET